MAEKKSTPVPFFHYLMRWNSEAVLRYLLATAGVICFGGCSMGGLIRISEPSINTTTNITDFSNGIASTAGLAVSVRPENHVPEVLTVGPLVFPVIPIGLASTTRRETLPFHVVLQFEPSSNEYSLTPMNVALLVDGLRYKPSRISEITTETFPAREHMRSIPGHDWYCDTNLSLTDWPSTRSIQITKGCMVLEFPLATISSRSTFGIELNGFRKGEVGLSFDTIQFRSSVKGIFFLLM